MGKRFEGRVTFVTGGGSGIGKGIAEAMAAEGAKVVAAGLTLVKTEEVAATIMAAGGEALGVSVDVADSESVKAAIGQAIDRFGRIDILVNNAGLSVGDTILDFDEAAWDRNLDVVLKGIYLCSREALPGMIERGSGVILNVGSVNGITGLGESAYSAAKAGMVNLTQNLAIHYGPKGVRANCIAPGTIRTPIWGARVEKEPQVFDNLAKVYPLGRVGEVSDVVPAALFLCSDDASWITGVTLPIDGGLTAGSFFINQLLQGG
ncbi:MAG: SDR family oxidoreductase [Thermomicrobiales bacterium]|nr:SDR family oxidoreductase [Thermomicrobiales bacterium]